MASSQEIAQINEIEKGLNSLNATISRTATEYMKLVKTIADNTVVLKEQSVTFDNLGKAQKQTVDNSKQLDSLGKQLAATEEKLKQLEDGRAETLIKNRIAIADNTKAIKDKVKAEQAAEGSLVRMRQKLIELQQAYDKTGTRTKAAAQEIDNLSKEIQKAEFATNRHQRNVGNYADAIGGLPGPIGNAVSSIQTMGKSLWALVANPIGATIALIIGALALLYKAFSSTDSGAVKMAGTMKAIGNIMDIVIDRAMSYYKMLWSLVTFDWDGVKKNATDAFGGIGKQILEVTNAGWNYAKVMDDIDDREVAAANRMTKLRVEIETLKNKAAAETGKKKLDLFQQAMDKEIELNGIEKGFLTERNDAETMNLASKINNNKLTMQQKADQLKQWLAVDDKELESLTKKDAAFAEFVNKNETEFQALQKTKADELNKEAELQKETRRLQKGLATERQSENAEFVRQQKEELKKVQELEKEKVKIITDGLDKQAKEINDSMKSEEDIYQDKIDIALKSDEKEFENWYDLQEKKKEKAKKLAEDTIDEEKDKAEKIRDIQIEMASEAINGIFDLGSAKRDREMSELDQQREKELSNKNLTESQKAKINEDYDRKAAAIKTKQAKADKLQAMFNIALNTAMGSMKAVAEFPITGGMPFLAWVIALGALQMGLVAAQKIPTFAKGGNAESGFGIFGEAGRELMFLRSGEVAMANQATYFEGSKFKGAQIKSNPETERLINATDHSGGRQMNDDRLITEMRAVGNEMKSVRKAIQNKPVAIFDKDHKQIGHATSHHQTIYLNKLMRNN